MRLLASVYRVISKHLGDSRFSGRPVSTPLGMRAGNRGGGGARMWTGGTSPDTPGDPLTQMARCANGKSESPARRLGRRKTARAGRPSAAVRLRQSTSNVS